MWETWVWSLGGEDPLEEGMATHSSILAWRIPWTEEPGGLQSMGSQRVGHDWATKHIFFFFLKHILLIVKREVHKVSHINILLLRAILITVMGMYKVLYVAYYRTFLLFWDCDTIELFFLKDKLEASLEPGKKYNRTGKGQEIMLGPIWEMSVWENRSKENKNEISVCLFFFFFCWNS